MNDMSTPPPPTTPPPDSDPPAPPAPPAAPPPAMPSAPQPTVNAADAIAGPATGLLVTAIVGAIANLLGLLLNVLGTGMGALGGLGDQGSEVFNMISGGIGIVSSLIGLAIAGLLVYATMEMKKLRNWNLAMAASILAMIPCVSPCCILGLPLGIWAVVVLTKPEIKSAFS